MRVLEKLPDEPEKSGVLREARREGEQEVCWMKVYIEEFLEWLSEWLWTGCPDNQWQKSCLKYTIA